MIGTPRRQVLDVSNACSYAARVVHDQRPIAAYRCTLVINDYERVVRTTGRGEQEVQRRFHEDELRRTRMFYDLDQPMGPGEGYEVMYADPQPQLVVEWGNVTGWEARHFVRGGTWGQRA